MPDAVKNRRPVGAAVLSVITPGLGQLYNGMPRRAMAFLIIAFLSIAVLNAIASSVSIWSSAAFIVGGILAILTICFYLFVIIDAYRGAVRVGQLELRRYNRWYVYLLVIAIAGGLHTAIDFSPIDGHAYSIPSASMVPTLVPGDRIFVSTGAYRKGPPERGDVVVHVLGNPSRGTYVKRVVGLPGDRIQIRDGILRINDAPALREPLEDAPQPGSSQTRSREPGTQYVETITGGRQYRIIEFGDTSRLDNTQEFLVPEGHYFAIGDNRDNSNDSRHPNVGFIPRENLRGRVLYVYWADDWSRIGALVE